MKRESMTPKERWLAVLQRKKPDRIPMDFWSTEEVKENLQKHFGCNIEEVFNKLHIDNPVGVGPEYVGPKLLPEGPDIYGLIYRKVDYGTGSYSEAINAPLAGYKTVDEIKKNYVFTTADLFDFKVVEKTIEGKQDRPIRGGGSEPLLTYKKLRGEEQAFIDLIENPEIVDYCLDQLFEFCYQTTLRIYETIPGKVNISYVAEDMGGQEDLMYSPGQIRRFLLPRMKRMMDLAHQAGAYVFFHSDGAVRKIIPDMIKTGIDVLNPIQWKCKGMERELLKKDFGDKIIFHGGVDNQYTIPFGKKEEVKQEVIENINILGKDGGYIFAPCHNIQPVTSIENIITMYETGYENGWY